ncbi:MULTISPECIES: hypothetical protein [unclassified Actinoplanes]|uniref:hypothetical protein n=1 Tax=unclassified Actinoplanes TaxID=2626549 RepID=UPI0012BADE3D|nr:MULTISPECIES: hypothetical protein [unclassified Actinoplanes]
MTKRSAVVASAVAVAVVGAGAAWAAWTLTGTGSATARAGDVQTLTVSGVSSTPLVPGGNADVKFHVVNPNAFPVLINGIHFSNITASGDCNAGSVTAVSTAPLPTAAGALELAAKDTVGGGDKKDITYAGSLHMSNAATDDCVGATFTFDVLLDAKSNAAA